jgi:hypothetical protein
MENKCPCFVCLCVTPLTTYSHVSFPRSLITLNIACLISHLFLCPPIAPFQTEKAILTVASGEMGMMPAACLPLFMELCRAGTWVTRGDPGLWVITTKLHTLWHEIIVLFFCVYFCPNRAKAERPCYRLLRQSGLISVHYCKILVSKTTPTSALLVVI